VRSCVGQVGLVAVISESVALLAQLVAVSAAWQMMPLLASC
jgi:hypothetical protein